MACYTIVAAFGIVRLSELLLLPRPYWRQQLTLLVVIEPRPLVSPQSLLPHLDDSLRTAATALLVQDQRQRFLHLRQRQRGRRLFFPDGSRGPKTTPPGSTESDGGASHTNFASGSPPDPLRSCRAVDIARWSSHNASEAGGGVARSAGDRARSSLPRRPRF